MGNPSETFRKVQVCIVVNDMREAMGRYGSLMGIDEFAVYLVDSRELSGVTYRGKPADYAVQVAIADMGGWQVELLQPLRGESIYKEFMDKYGEGVQHLGFFVEKPEDYPAMWAQLEKERGYVHLQGGPILGETRNGSFDYFDSKNDLGVIIELLDMPALPEASRSSV
jgi:hypothetical protein